MLSAITGILSGACALLAGASFLLALLALVVARRRSGCLLALAACGLAWAAWAVILGHVSEAVAMDGGARWPIPMG